MKMTNQKQIRAAFWELYPHFDEQAREAGIRSKSQNYHPATVRCKFCDFVELLRIDGTISESLANRATL